ADDSRLTETGFAPGTLGYMAPERLQENPNDEDARVDIYALACILYECLTGRPPFRGTSHASLIAAHLTCPPPKPSATQPNVSAQLDTVVAKGMAKDPENRYATTVALADAAHDAITVPLDPTRPASRRMPRPRRLGRRTRIALVAGGLAVVAVVAVVLAVVVLSGGSPSAPIGSKAAPKPAPPQVVLPFTGLTDPGEVAVDPGDNLYVADWGNHRVL